MWIFSGSIISRWGKTVFILLFRESASVVQSLKSETDYLFDGLSELMPVSVMSLVDLLVGEVFPPVPCVFFNNNDRSLVSLSYDKELFLSLECGECSTHSRPEVFLTWSQRSLFDDQEEDFSQLCYESF